MPHRLALLVAACLAGCWSNTSAPPPARDAAQACPAPNPGPNQPWRKRIRSGATANLMGAPHHAATDPVIAPAQPAVVRGKFAYGKLSKDLEGEKVSLFLRMRPCGRWRELTSGLTDSDGRIELEIPARWIREPGAYPYQLIVRGDGSRAYGTVFVAPRGTRAVVFDVDATLTTANSELFKELAWGHDQKPRPLSQELVRRYVRAGYLPVYLTGRMYMMREFTRTWLIRHGYPPGPLLTSDRFSEALPGHERIGRFKLRELQRLEAAGLIFSYAYGDADTDVCAYARAGIDPERTFIFSGAARTGCDGKREPNQLGDLTHHLRTFVRNVPRADRDTGVRIRRQSN